MIKNENNLNSSLIDFRISFDLGILELANDLASDLSPFEINHRFVDSLRRCNQESSVFIPSGSSLP